MTKLKNRACGLLCLILVFSLLQSTSFAQDLVDLEVDVDPIGTEYYPEYYESNNSLEAEMANDVVDDKATNSFQIVRPYSTASYYYWRQTGSTFLYLKEVGNWITESTNRVSTNGDQLIMNWGYSQSPSVSFDISVSGKIFGAGLSITPGSSATISGSASSSHLSPGLYDKRYIMTEKICNIQQDYYYYEFGRDYYIYSKTGQQGFPNDPNAKFVRVGN